MILSPCRCGPSCAHGACPRVCVEGCTLLLWIYVPLCYTVVYVRYAEICKTLVCSLRSEKPL